MIPFSINKRNASFGPRDQGFKPPWIVGKDQTEGGIDHRHDHLNFNASAGPELARSGDDSDFLARLDGTEGAILDGVKISHRALRYLELVVI